MKSLKKLRNQLLLINLIATSLVVVVALTTTYLTSLASQEIRELNSLGDMTNNLISDDIVMTSSKLTGVSWFEFIGIEVEATGYAEGSGERIPRPEGINDSSGSSTIYVVSDGEYIENGQIWRFQKVDVEIHESFSAYIVVKHINAFLDVTEVRAAQINQLFTFIFMGTAILVAIFFVSRFVAGRAIRPVAEAWERQQRFVADASHELKTPLMTIMSNCDVLEANVDDTIKNQQLWLESIRLGTERMTKLVNGLLTLTHTEGKDLAEQKSRFSLNGLIDELTQSMQAAMEEKDLHLSVPDCPETEILACKDAIFQILAILLENAIKYANVGGDIEMSARLSGKQAVVSVRNTGEGIAPEDLPHVFDRFYRADAARNAEENSYGLGLAIARATVESLGGNISAKSDPGAWTEFVCSFEVSLLDV